MSRPAFFLALNASGWTVARAGGDSVDTREVPVTESPLSEAALADLAAALEDLGYGGHDVCLGLPSTRVLADRIDTANLPRRNRHTAMLYRFEDQLPVEAERLTADFIAGPGGSALGVAVETDRMRTIVDRLGDSSIHVAAICPTALLALWQVVRQAAPDVNYILVAAAEQFDLFRLAEGSPIAWQTVATDVDEVTRALAADQLLDPVGDARPTVLVVGPLPDGLGSHLSETAGIAVEAGPSELAPLAATAGAARLAGRPAGWVDLRRDDLSEGSHLDRLGPALKLAATLLVLLPALVAALCFWRSHRYGELTNHLADQQIVAYRQAVPGGSLPTDLRKRLEAEHARLAALRGADANLPDSRCALEMLRNVTASLPASLRLRITAMQLGPPGVVLKGQARSHTDAQAIAKALTRGGFQVDPPSTESLVRGGVTFTLTARPAARKSATVAKATGRSTP